MWGAVLALMVVPLVVPASAHADVPMRDVIVTFHRQAPLPRAGADDRLVERALRRTAAHAQRRALALLRRRRAAGAVRSVRSFWIVNALEVVATPRVLAELAADPDVASVRRNAAIGGRAALAHQSSAPAAPAGENVALIGAPALWARGVTGAGVVIASVDGGVDAAHPDLAASFRGGANSWFDATGEHPRAPIDTSGHGTATMGVMVGSGAGGTTLGVAPGARWIAARIFDDRGRTKPSWIHSAFQWLLDPDGRPQTRDAAQVVNASWARPVSGCDLELEGDLRTLRAAGIVPVFASGNDLHDASPANSPSALAVGAVDAAGGIARGSGRGHSTCGQPVYPQIVAPGVDIPTTDVAGLYATQSGTSVAAPHVSGALALLLSRFPRLSALRQETALEAGAVDLGAPGPDNTFGFGRLDVAASYHWLTTAPDLTLTPDRWSLGARAGRRVGLRVGLRAVHGFSGTVRLSAEGLPRGVTAKPLSARLGSSRTLKLTLATTTRAQSGDYPVTIRATSGARSRTVVVGLTVRPR